MANEEAGVKEPEGTGDLPNPQTPPVGSEPVKTPEELAEELLKNPPKDKRIVDVDRFNDLNEKAKLYETHAPLLDKILKDPELVEQLLETKEKGDLASRVAKMEEERNTEKRNELRSAVVEALSKWPGLEKDWTEISEDVTRLARKGLSYRDALRRSYLALHPEEAQAEAERVARENANVLGKFQTSVSYSPKIKIESSETELTPGEQQIAKALGKTEKEYGALLKKHEAHMKAKGFYDSALEIEL